MFAVSGITAKVQATPKPLKNYRPAFEGIVLGKPIAPQDQELVATVKGIIEKLDSHSTEKGVEEKIKAIQVDFAARIDNNIIRMCLENLDFLVDTVPKEQLPRILEICHKEMLANPDRADAIPRVLGNIHLLNGKLSDGSIRQMMRTGFGRSTSLCPKEVSAVLKVEYDSGRLDHIEGVAETRAVQEQTVLPQIIAIPSGLIVVENKPQDLIVATNFYHPTEIMDATSIPCFIQLPYQSSEQAESYRTTDNIKPEPDPQVIDMPVQKSEQRAESVQTKADMPLAKILQKVNGQQTPKEEDKKESQTSKTTKQKTMKSSEPEQIQLIPIPDLKTAKKHVVPKAKKAVKPTEPETRPTIQTTQKDKKRRKEDKSEISWLKLRQKNKPRNRRNPEKVKDNIPKPAKKAKEKKKEHANVQKAKEPVKQKDKKFREKKPVKESRHDAKGKIKEKSVTKHEVKGKIKIPKGRKEATKAKITPKDRKIHTNKKTGQASKDKKEHIKPKVIARKKQPSIAKKIQRKMRKQRKLILKIILGKRRTRAKSSKLVSRKRT